MHQSFNHDRDERLDFLRGLAIIAVIINHMGGSSLYSILTVEAVGVVSAAEVFVLISGIILGQVNRFRCSCNGLQSVFRKTYQRTLKIYSISAATSLFVYYLQWLPGLDASVLVSYSDLKTGVIYPLYGESHSAWSVLKGILLLNHGPGQINILGFYIALLILTPGFVWLLEKRRPALLSALSWLAYCLHQHFRAHILPFQSENAFPLLAWQVLFVHGLILGYYRDRIKRFLTRHAREALATGFLLFSGFCFIVLNNPWYDIPRLSLIPEPIYYWIYSNFFQRTNLGLGRMLNTVVVVFVMYRILSRSWAPIQGYIGWLCIPLGKASLYIFIVHLGTVLAVGNIAAMQQDNLLINTAGITIMIGVIWLMVKYRILFSVIPR